MHNKSTQSYKRFSQVGLIMLAYGAVEYVVGIFAHSIALVADCGHSISDSLAILTSVLIGILAKRPPSNRFSFGLRRLDVLGAILNSLLLICISVYIVFQAINRLTNPIPRIYGQFVIGLPILGLGIMIYAMFLTGDTGQSLNQRAICRHILSDSFTLLSTLIAGILIEFCRLYQADAISSLVTASLILGYSLFGTIPALKILLEGVPNGIDLELVRSHIARIDGVKSVHDMHVWNLDLNLPLITAHVVVSQEILDRGYSGQLLDRLQICLSNHFSIEHSTFQLESPFHLEHEFPPH